VTPVTANQDDSARSCYELEGNRVVPFAFRMQARGVTAGGAPGIQFDDEVQNIMYGVNSGRFQNLGRVVPEGYVK
nr:hypothetical protein [Streptomyces sp. DSM 41633]